MDLQNKTTVASVFEADALSPSELPRNEIEHHTYPPLPNGIPKFRINDIAKSSHLIQAKRSLD